MGHQQQHQRAGRGAPYPVRDALQKDIPGICATLPAAFGLFGGPWADPDYIADGLAACAANLSSRQRVKVALASSKVVGSSYSGLALAPDGVTAYTEVGVIHGIAVRPESRGRGAATALLAACEDDLRTEGARVIVAEVRPGAVGFFSACGYQSADGPALVIPTAVGTCVYPQSIFSTVLMWRTVRGDVLVPQPTGKGTTLPLPAASRRKD
jgi:ribosomal protein S18 acetylase RimI-like enzyme